VPQDHWVEGFCEIIDAPLEEPYDLEDAMRLYALAELRRSQGRAEEALAAALAGGRAVEQSMPFFEYCRWRGPAAQAALALGDRERALALAEEMLARAEQTKAPHHRIEALRVAGICEGASAGLDRLRAAVELGRSLPPRLDTIAALIEFGAALRRANERGASRLPLQEAADLAHRGGATGLYRRARTELAASGARPRREALLSGPASLTPSERRVAEVQRLKTGSYTFELPLRVGSLLGGGSTDVLDALSMLRMGHAGRSCSWKRSCLSW